MKQYRLGLIGFGGMGHHHYNALTTFDVGVKPYGVFDLDPKRMAEAREKGLVAYATAEDLFRDPNVDIVLVATSNNAHKEYSLRGLAAGKHVLCEKPVCMNSQELSEIMEAEKTAKGLFTVDQNRRTNADYLLMRQVMESGKLGKVYRIESRVHGCRGLTEGWRISGSLGGGMMLDWGVHMIDQILFAFRQKVTRVYCKMFRIKYPEVDDNFTLEMTFEDGLSVMIECDTNNYLSLPRWYVLGEEGTLRIDDWDCGGELIRGKKDDDSWKEIVILTSAGPTTTMAPRLASSMERETVKARPEDFLEGLSGVYKGFVGAIEGCNALPITSTQAMRVMKVMEAAFRSAETGESVPVEE